MTAALDIIAKFTNQASPEAKKLAADVGDVGKESASASSKVAQLESTQNKLALAMHQSQDAAAKLAKAQADLSQNTDPGKADALRGAVLKAQVALDKQTESVGKLRNELDGLDGSASDAGTSIDGAGVKTQVAGAAMNVAAVGAAALGAAVIAAGVALVNTADDANKAVNTIQVGLGETREEAERLGTVAEEVWKNNFGDSIDDAATAIVLARQQLGELADNELQRAAENAFRLRDAFGVELPESMSAVNTLMEQFGLTSDEAFDFIASGFQKGLDRSGDFLDSVGEYSVQFAAGGADASEFFSLLESGLQGGMLGTDKAADAFKEFRVRIQDGSTATTQALEMIGLSSTEMAAKMADGTLTAADAFQVVMVALNEVDDKNIQMQAGVGLLGTQFEDLGTDGALALSMIGTEAEDLVGAIDSLDAQYDNLGDNVESIKRNMLILWLPAAEAATRRLTDVTSRMVDTLMAQEAVMSAYDDGNISLERRNELMRQFNRGQIDAEGLMKALTGSIEKQGKATEIATDDLSAWYGEASRAAMEATTFTTATDDLVTSQNNAAEVMRLANVQILEQGGSLGMTSREAEELAYATGELSGREEQLAAAIEAAKVKTDEQTAAMEAAAEAARIEDEAIAALNERLGGYFDKALTAADQTLDFESTLYDMAQQAGLGAEEMAIAAAATGNFTAEQIEAAFQTALMTENIRQLVQEVGAGNITMDDAVAALDRLKSGTATTAAEAITLGQNIANAASETDALIGAANNATDALNGIPTDIGVHISVTSDPIPSFPNYPGGDEPVAFATGGYTGNQPGIAGLVHGREFVLNEQAVNRWGLPMLEMMNQGGGGSTTATPVLQSTGGGGSTTISIAIDARGNNNPAAVEEAGYRGAKRALQEAGHRADTLRRTR